MGRDAAQILLPTPTSTRHRQTPTNYCDARPRRAAGRFSSLASHAIAAVATVAASPAASASLDAGDGTHHCARCDASPATAPRRACSRRPLRRSLPARRRRFDQRGLWPRQREGGSESRPGCRLGPGARRRLLCALVSALGRLLGQEQAGAHRSRPASEHRHRSARRRQLSRRRRLSTPGAGRFTTPLSQ